MFVDIDKVMDRAITVFTMVPAKLGKTEEDAYHTLEIEPAFWSETFNKTTDADGAVHYTRAVKVQIPASSATMVTLAEYAAKAAEGDVEGIYALDTHSLIGLGKLGSGEVLTRQEANERLSTTSGCSVSMVRDLRKNGGVTAPDEGCAKYASVVYAEGK